MASGLRFGPLGPRSVRLCVDMQTLFAERVLPAVTRLAAARPERTVFTRFMPPERPEGRSRSRTISRSAHSSVPAESTDIPDFRDLRRVRLG